MTRKAAQTRNARDVQKLPSCVGALMMLRVIVHGHAALLSFNH